MSLPGGFVRFHSVLSAVKCVLTELLNKRMTSHVVRDGILISEFNFGLKENKNECRDEDSGRVHTCSNLSIKFMVYALLSSSV